MKVANKYLIKRSRMHSNFTEKNHLGQALLLQPEKLAPVFDEIFASSQYSKNSLMSSMILGDNKMEVTSDEWTWDMKDATERPCVVLETVVGEKPGLGRRRFELVLDTEQFKNGDVLRPSDENGRYQVRVVDDVRHSGAVGFIYTVEIMNDSPTLFLPEAFGRKGALWTKLYSQYGEGAELAGSTNYSTSVGFHNRLSRYRKEYTVTGDVVNEVLAVKLIDSKGNSTVSWIRYAEAEYWSQWYYELQKGMYYSRSTSTRLDSTGRPLLTGPGLQEQLEVSHVHRYSTLTTRLLEEYLMDIYFGRVMPGSARKIRAYTGEIGMRNFSKAIESEVRGRNLGTVIDSSYAIEKIGSPMHTNALSYGYQFTKYKMYNGTELELIHEPAYDDQSLHTRRDPVTGYPAESSRITFLDFSGEGTADANVKQVTRKGAYGLAYVAGMATPTGRRKGGDAAHSGDYYKMVVQDKRGVHVHDLSRCGELILSTN